jgi:hypothetical protein
MSLSRRAAGGRRRHRPGTSSKVHNVDRVQHEDMQQEHHHREDQPAAGSEFALMSHQLATRLGAGPSCVAIAETRGSRRRAGAACRWWPMSGELGGCSDSGSGDDGDDADADTGHIRQRTKWSNSCLSTRASASKTSTLTTSTTTRLPHDRAPMTSRRRWAAKTGPKSPLLSSARSSVAMLIITVILYLILAASNSQQQQQQQQQQSVQAERHHQTPFLSDQTNPTALWFQQPVAHFLRQHQQQGGQLDNTESNNRNNDNSNDDAAGDRPTASGKSHAHERAGQLARRLASLIISSVWPNREMGRGD